MWGMSVAQMPLQSYAVTALHSCLGHAISQMAPWPVHSVLGPRAGHVAPPSCPSPSSLRHARYISLPGLLCGGSPTGCDFPACILVLGLFSQSRCWDEEEIR